MTAERITSFQLAIERAADNLVDAMRILESCGQKESALYAETMAQYGEVLNIGIGAGNYVGDVTI